MIEQEQLKNICFYYKNLLTNELKAKGILKTKISLLKIHALFDEGKRFEEVLDYIDKNDQNAVYVELKDYSFEKAKNDFSLHVYYYLNTNKFIANLNKKE